MAYLFFTGFSLLLMFLAYKEVFVDREKRKQAALWLEGWQIKELNDQHESGWGSVREYVYKLPHQTEWVTLEVAIRENKVIKREFEKARLK